MEQLSLIQDIEDRGAVCARCGQTMSPYIDKEDESKVTAKCRNCNTDKWVERGVYDVSKYMVEVRWFRPLPGLRPIEVSPAYQGWLYDQIEAAHPFVSAVITRAISKGFIEVPATGQPTLQYATLVTDGGSCYVAKFTMVSGRYVPIAVLYDTWVDYSEFEEHYLLAYSKEARFVERRSTILPEGYPDCEYSPIFIKE